MSAIYVTCDTCHRTHIVVPGTGLAHATGPNQARSRVPMTHAMEGTEAVYAWDCTTCGRPLTYRAPAWERVTCTHEPGASGHCRVADRRAKPPADLYVNPRHGTSCPCCGLEGAHWVRVDQDPDSLPLCMRNT